MRRVIAKAAASRDTLTVEQLRALQGPPAPKPVDVRGVTFRPQTLAGREVEIAEPASDLGDADVLFLHGGGFIAGTPSTQRKLVGAIARDARVRVWSFDYRLAPEHPFPAALDDGLAAYREILDRIDLTRLILMGESAGGNLAASGLLAARDAGLPLPAAVVLMAPFTDLTMSAPSIEENTGKDILTPAFVETCRDAYVGRHDPSDQRASPLFGDLSGLPPTLLQVGDLDLIRDDSVRFAAAAKAAGSPADARVWPDVSHGFVGSGDDLPESRQAIAEIATWIRTQLPAVP
jgi:acetyl esterase/lipase